MHFVGPALGGILAGLLMKVIDKAHEKVIPEVDGDDDDLAHANSGDRNKIRNTDDTNRTSL